MPRVGACWGDASILNFVGVVSFLPTAEGLSVLVSSMTQWKTQTAFQLTSRLLYARLLQARCTAATRPAVELVGPSMAMESCPHPDSTCVRSAVVMVATVKQKNQPKAGAA